MMELGADGIFVGSGILNHPIQLNMRKQLWKQQHIQRL
jgi:pyridoxal biosynthesis lyase PdxS